jgi:hypothetical protein
MQEIDADLIQQVATFRPFIREVAGLNRGRHTDYPDWGFAWFSTVDSSQVPLPPALFQINYLLIVQPFAMYSELLTASLNKS